MRTIETTVYDFNELSKEAKEKAIEKWYENEDYPWLEDDMAQFLSENDPYFYDKKIQYSLCYCQGDGLSFAANFKTKKWLDEKTELKESVKNALLELCTIKSVGNTGNHYCYASDSDIKLDFEHYSRGSSYKEFKNIEELAKKISDEISDYYMDLCKKAENYGYGVLEYRMDEEEFDEYCQENGYTFLSDGTMKNF